MKRGPWHQFGDRSQRLVIEQLQQGIGQGTILSARDLSLDNAEDYAREYKALGADIIFDSQFHIPDFTNRYMVTYDLGEFRTSASTLGLLTDHELDELAVKLETINRRLRTDAVLAPAVVYQAGRTDILDLNAKLFEAGKRVGDAIGVPTYATIIIGRSAATSEHTIEPIVSQATNQSADGWYYGFEFAPERVPSVYADVLRCYETVLTLAATGQPLLHAFAGPMSVLSLAAGATAVGIGHSQNLWKFSPDRWRPAEGGGGGNAPARFFSRALWGTIIVPDEIVRLGPQLQAQILTLSPFSGSVLQNPATPYDRWTANKHLVAVIASQVEEISQNTNPRDCAALVQTLLADAVAIHTIVGAQFVLADGTSSYQEPWLRVVTRLLQDRGDDYDFLELLS